MKKPNFFIIGAPKCGTTALAAWLSEHPRIYVSPIKEPHHFDTDHPFGIKNRQRYEKLFSRAFETHIAVGEASVKYLHSKRAVPNILDYAESPKFIVMVRNPIEVAYSFHAQKVYDLDEQILDFSSAWNSQENRRRGEYISPYCADPSVYQYAEYASIGTQIIRLMKIVPKNSVKIILFDDFKASNRSVYKDVLSFLEVPDDGRKVFPRINDAKRWRSEFLASIMKTGIGVKNRVGLNGLRFGLADKLAKRMTVAKPNPQMSEETFSMLAEYFEEEIRIIEQVFQRELPHWRTQAP